MRGFLMFEIMEKMPSRNMWEAVRHVEIESKTKKEMKRDV